jgi:hypothetical protein
MKYSSDDLKVFSGAKRTESSRRRGVVMDALRQAKMEATKRGLHDTANLLGIAGMALTDEALNAIYAAVAADAAR